MLSIRERQILAAKEARDKALAEQQQKGENKQQ
jgi:hypothetical protein